MSDFLTKYYYSFFWHVATNAKHIIANSKQTKSELVTALNIDENKISVVNLGVDEKFKPLPRNKTSGQSTIGYLSSMTRRKRVDKAIEFFKSFQDKYCNLGGRTILKICGPLDVKHLQCINPFEVVRRLNVRNVEIKGFVPENKIVETYNSFDVFLYTSDYEGFGLPIIEAVSCGVPTIVRENSKITPEVKSLCVPVNDSNAADVIYSLLTDKSYRKNVISNGLKRVRKFSWGECVRNTERVYELVC
jgi:glycosyltransferase involved in cell wall biosynthesis